MLRFFRVDMESNNGQHRSAAKRRARNRRVGRPTKFNEKTVVRLYAALADGMPIKGTCVVAGIGLTTLAEWKNPGRYFAKS